VEQAARRVAIAGLLLLCTSCGNRLEQHLLRTYFDTCAIADAAILANMALVWLDPARDGTVGRFEIVEVGPRERHEAKEDAAAVRISLRDPARPAPARVAVLVSESVSVRAEVHYKGTITRRTFTVTLARAETEDTVGRWVVVRLVPGGRTVPAASSGPQ
jgi:hypothetical protein